MSGDLILSDSHENVLEFVDIMPVSSGMRDGNSGIIIISNSPNTEMQISPVHYFRFEQSIPSDIWHILHTMNKKPSVTITDSAGSVVEGAIQYIDNYNIIVTFSAGFSGFAELN
jgi:hypothetical protein